MGMEKISGFKRSYALVILGDFEFLIFMFDDFWVIAVTKIQWVFCWEFCL